MKSRETRTHTLVLGAGGVAGIAWELGVLMGLHDTGVTLLGADLIIGTSAGAAVGALITSGIDLESLFASQLIPVEPSKKREVVFDPEQMMEALRRANAEAGPDSKAIRARIGAYAKASSTISEAQWRARWETLLPVHTWPQQRLLIVTIDIETGEEYLIDRVSGISLVDAVAASCAIPGIFPAMTIAGRRYMDGGVRRSTTNADLARGSDRIVILNPLGANANFFGGAGPDEEAAVLEREGSHVLVIAPDAALTTVIGQHPVDPTIRQPVALAGRTQGRELGTAVATFWSPA